MTNILVPSRDPLEQPASNQPNTRLRTALQGLRILLAVGIIGGLVYKVYADRDSVAALSIRGSVWDFAGALGFTWAGLGALPLGFMLLLRRAQLYRIGQHWFYYRLWLQSYFYRYVPGKVMLLAERVRLGAMAGLGPALSLLLLFWESVLLMAGACLLAVLMLLAAQDAGPVAWPYLTGAVVACVLGLVGLPGAVTWAAQSPKLRPYLRDMQELRLRPLDQLLLTVTYAVIWSILGIGFFFFCRWFSPLSMGALPCVVFAFVTGYVGGQVAGVIPGGLGVREGVMVLGLLGTVEPGQAVALAIAERIWMTLLELVTVGWVTKWVKLPTSVQAQQPDIASPSDVPGL